MLKKIISILLFCFALFVAEAQPPGIADREINADTVYKKVLLIPYSPMMHLSDTDNDIAGFMGISNEQVRSAFRTGLSREVKTQILKVYPAYSLLTSLPGENEKDLDIIYGSINYTMDTVFPVSHPVNDTVKGKLFFSKSRTSKLKEIQDLKFMNITLSHPELLDRLSVKYGTDLFVFLNQFEMVTNYDDCLDLALKIYRRQLKVHYSVFDVNAKLLYGDVAVVDFPSNSNDTREIMMKNFPKLADYIVKSIPKKKLTSNDGITQVTIIRK